MIFFLKGDDFMGGYLVLVETYEDEDVRFVKEYAEKKIKEGYLVELAYSGYGYSAARIYRVK